MNKTRSGLLITTIFEFYCFFSFLLLKMTKAIAIFYLPFERWFFFHCQPGHFCVTMPFCFFLSVIKMLNERVVIVFLLMSIRRI